MIKLDKTKVYDLSELTSNEKGMLLKHLQETSKNNWHAISCFNNKRLAYFTEFNSEGEWLTTKKPSTTNAKELFYTLENVQVDCSELSEEQIEEMADVFEKSGFKLSLDGTTDEHFYLRLAKCGKSVDLYRLDDTKTTITYDKFIELFGDRSVTSGNNQPPVYSVGSGMTTNKISLSIKPEGVVKFLADKDVFLSPEDYKKLFE